MVRPRRRRPSASRIDISPLAEPLQSSEATSVGISISTPNFCACT
jgi:hypothetical protein